jgi:hypothetical protein
VFENWQPLIVAICVAAAAWWLGRRVLRFVRALRNPNQSVGCGACEQCPSSQQPTTEEGVPIVSLQIAPPRSGSSPPSDRG